MTPIFPSFIVKRHAKMAMRGKFFKTLGATMLPALIVSLISVILIFIPPVYDAVSLYARGTFANVEEQTLYSVEIINNLIYGVILLVALFYFLVIGGEKVCLDIIRGKETKVSKIFMFYEKWYIACIWPAISLLLTIVADVVISFMEKSNAPILGIEVFLWVWQLINLIISAKTMFIPYILADNNCESFIKAFIKSWKMVDLRCVVSIFLLYMSFIGWFVLIFFTGFAIVYVYPYFKLSMATLYHLTLTGAKQEQTTQEE